MHRGYIKVWRRSIDSAIWKNLNAWRVFEYCLLKATHKPITLSVGQAIVNLERGQLVFGRRQAAYDCGISEGQVRGAIVCLRRANMIASNPTNKYSILTIVNYGHYQDDNRDDNQQDDQQDSQQMDNKQPTDNQQITTNNNKKHISTSSSSCGSDLDFNVRLTDED